MEVGMFCEIYWGLSVLGFMRCIGLHNNIRHRANLLLLSLKIFSLCVGPKISGILNTQA